MGFMASAVPMGSLLRTVVFHYVLFDTLNDKAVTVNDRHILNFFKKRLLLILYHTYSSDIEVFKTYE